MTDTEIVPRKRDREPADSPPLVDVGLADELLARAQSEGPTPGQEAARDLVRARDAVRADLMRSRHRLSKLLLRHGLVYSEGKAWTSMHDRWLRRQSFGSVATQAAFDHAYETVALAAARRDGLDEKITALAGDSEFTATVHRLACLRGISILTGFALAVEVGDWDRFTGASIGAYLRRHPRIHPRRMTRIGFSALIPWHRCRIRRHTRGNLAAPTLVAR